MQAHTFLGSWITTEEFATLNPRNVFHRQLDKSVKFPEEHMNRHILFRKKFDVIQDYKEATLYITADDYYKLYINGQFVTQGPTPAYPFAYTYNTVDISSFLRQGENLIAVHTYYQGMINRVWVSGDNRHGLLCDLEIDGTICLQSDSSFLVQMHSGYKQLAFTGAKTQFLEEYNSNASEIGFFTEEFDDSNWTQASVRTYVDYQLIPKQTESLVFEKKLPEHIEIVQDRFVIDFGKCYVGYLNVVAKGKKDEKIIVRCGHELNEDGTVRYQLRANCTYEEEWTLSGKEDQLDWFDYKSFRYVEIIAPADCVLKNIYLNARHYPFELKTNPKPEYSQSKEILSIWDLCVNTLQYGVQEVIQDCMDREKGFYVGDGCYTALAHMILTHDDAMVRYLIDSARLSSSFVKTTVTCLNCSFMQEIAEFPLILVSLILWHYKWSGDKEYLKQNYAFAKGVVENYRIDYEQDGLLKHLDKWCVVEWPDNYRDGYDVDLKEGQICEPAHMVINAYYLEAISNLNKIAELLGESQYRDLTKMKNRFFEVFYDEKNHVFKDSEWSSHSSYISNVFAYGFGLLPDMECEENILTQIKEKGISNVSLFGAFPMLCGLIKNGEEQEVKNMLLDEGAWLRMLREGATTTFEGWGKECKRNASLFHLTMSYAAVFIADIDHKKLFI